MRKFYSNGKLLLTGEYVVLDGAKALALPVKFGQDLIVTENDSSEMKWISFDHHKKTWFTCSFSLKDLSFSGETDQKTARTLQKILRETRTLNPEFLSSTRGLTIETSLNFPREWGLGTSSTLINNIAQWAEVNPYTLLYKSFGGSGYDIACAQHNTPVLFQMNGDEPFVEEVSFDPEFKDQLFFVYLNKKQNSGKEIGRYKAKKTDISLQVQEIDLLTDHMIRCKNLKDFEKILIEHENIISSVLGKEPIQNLLFPDYSGQIKSLGAWGGDFILATGNENTPGYFKKKAFKTIFSFDEMSINKFHHLYPPI